MKPPRFTYHDPSTLEEALALLASHRDDAKVLAGGQSLMPILNFRLARPGHLVDLNRIPELGSLVAQNGGLSLGAMVRQRTLERSPLVQTRAPLVTRAMPFVGHSQIRNRGTLGGSLAHADPASELPAVMIALEARLILRRAGSERVVSADGFFEGALSTVLAPDELLTRIDLPPWPADTGASLEEVAKRQGDFALGGVATTLTLGPDGRILHACIVCFGVDERPVRMGEAAASLAGAAPGEVAFAEAGRLVSARLKPPDDIHASGAYRKRLVGVLTRRALAASAPTGEERAA